MSPLETLLQRDSEPLIARWIARLRAGIAPAGHSELELRDHIPVLLQELRAALRDGRVPAHSEAAEIHGRQRYRVGFDVEALVREYSVLRNCIFDLAEENGLALPMPEIRVLVDFVANAIAEGVTEYHRLRIEQEQARTAANILAEQNDVRARRSALEAERQKLHDLFMEAPVAICINEGPELVYTFANEAYYALVGGRELIGKRFCDAFPDLAGQGYEATLGQVFTTGVSIHEHARPASLMRDGREHTGWFNIALAAKHNEAGEIDGVMQCAFEVTEQVQGRLRSEALTEELRAREAELRTVMDAIPLLVSFVDADERYALVNKAYESWFGRPREALAGQRVEDVIGPAAYAQLGGFVRRSLAGEKISLEQHGVAYHGGTRDVRITFIPQLGLEGAVAGYVAVIEDISERRRLEQQREHAQEVLARQAEFEQQLIGIVSHDLRNPLNVILLSSARLARSEELGAAALKNSVRIQNAAERAVRMVGDLLDFTQARLAGGIRIERRPTDLDVIVSAVLDEVEAAHPGRELQVTSLGDAHGEWDHDRLVQVVQNLVTNALKYSPHESIVQVSIEADAQQVTLVVHNEGPAIPEAMQPLLFEPFQRAVAQVDKVSRSVGLGLYIVRQVVLAHEGTVRLDSSEPEGTTFTVCLPRAPSSSSLPG